MMFEYIERIRDINPTAWGLPLLASIDVAFVRLFDWRDSYFSESREPFLHCRHISRMLNYYGILGGVQLTLFGLSAKVAGQTL